MALRLATWNCFRGDPGERLSELASLRPDVVCLQEVAAPQQLIPNSIYRAQTSVQGVLLWAREDLLLTAVAEERANGNRALAFLGAAMGVGLAGVWAQSEPSYTRDVLGSLEAARMALGSVPLIFLGDFNASPTLSRGGAEHAKLVATLEEDGLCSAYHSTPGGLWCGEPSDLLLAVEGGAAVPPGLLLRSRGMGIADQLC